MFIFCGVCVMCISRSVEVCVIVCWCLMVMCKLFVWSVWSCVCENGYVQVIWLECMVVCMCKR